MISSQEGGCALLLALPATFHSLCVREPTGKMLKKQREPAGAEQ